VPRDVADWIPWVRLIATPFTILEVLIERGNYPPGYERWAWLVTGVFVVGALFLFVLARTGRGLAAPAGLGFDLVLLSSYVAVYSFEAGTPVRQILFVAVVEAGVLYGRLGGAVTPFGTAPALAFFEWKQSEELSAPYDPGHVLGPVGIALLIGVLVGTLSERAGSHE
jgi:hypothetical protein